MMKPDVCDFTCLEVDEEIKRYVFFREHNKFNKVIEYLVAVFRSDIGALGIGSPDMFT